MLLKFGTDVISQAGDKVGELESVIIDPAKEEITHLIVKKGFLLRKNKMVPISLVADSNDQRIKLHEFEGEFDDLQDYQETYFIPVENYINKEVDGKIIPLLFYPPNPITTTHAAHPASVPVVKENLATDKESLEEGMNVVALDNHKVGGVKEVILHPTTDRVTHLLVSKGLLFKHQFLIPSEWVRDIKESAVHLYVDSKVIEKLPDYKHEGILT